MDYCVSVRSPWILGEAGATMRCKSDAMLSANIQEVEISHDCPVVEPLTEQRGCSIASQNIGGQIGGLSRRGVLWELKIIDDAINDLRLRQLDLATDLILDVDAKVIFDVSLVLDF